MPIIFQAIAFLSVFGAESDCWKQLKRVVEIEQIVARGNIRPINTLLEKIHELNLRVKIIPVKETDKLADGTRVINQFLGRYKIILINSEDIQQGSLLLSPSKSKISKQIIYTTHIGVKKEVRGNGLGTFLYALGAKLTFDKCFGPRLTRHQS
jgi:hypothetical protein